MAGSKLGVIIKESLKSNNWIANMDDKTPLAYIQKLFYPIKLMAVVWRTEVMLRGGGAEAINK